VLVRYSQTAFHREIPIEALILILEIRFLGLLLVGHIEETRKGPHLWRSEKALSVILICFKNKAEVN